MVGLVWTLLVLGWPTTAGAPSVWPLPIDLNLLPGPPIRLVPPAQASDFFQLESRASSPILAAAFARYAPLLFPHPSRVVVNEDSQTGVGARSRTLSFVTIRVTDLDESHPTLHTDESYTLSVRELGLLTAATVYGALRGLETLSQLVVFDFDTESYYAPSVAIRDAPRFPHRGLMIDTARHFEPLSAIRAMIDALPYAKLNVLHWHMVDAQSFPFQSLSSPRLWDGAFSPSERYTQADVAAVVEYARLRGVRVMVEFDMPGHNDAWCTGYPSICPSASCKSPLNVASNETFGRISALLRELTGGRSSSRSSPSGLFPDELLHLGGDEVNTECWHSTPSVYRLSLIHI